MTDRERISMASKLRARAFRLLALLVAPVVFFALAELLLAIMGFGGWPPLFVESANRSGSFEPNSQVMRRYFPQGDAKLGIEPILFKRERPAATTRLVVQGGSTAAGFPYGRFAGLAGMLGDRLEAVHPGRDIEVVTTAMAAVNSYTLLDFVDEIIAIEPDAVLIYAGHNEYVGVFGAGSALTTQRSRTATKLHLRLSHFRVYQLLSSSFALFKHSRGESGDVSSNSRDTLMAKAASSPEIPLDSNIYREGRLQFESNLREILSRYQRAEVPVYIGTLASNERDQAPFSGGVLDEALEDEFESAFNRCQGEYQAGNLGAARAKAFELLQIDPEAANGWFMMGRIEEAAGNFEKAASAYSLAKEFDRLRFRAPEVFNQVIRKLAVEFGARLVDVRGNFVSHTRNGLVGKELMLEHLHPNARGYFVLADAYFKALEEDRLLGPAEVAWSDADAFADMPITAVDRALASQAVREIRNDYPFRPDRIETPFPEPRNEVMEIAKRIYEDPGAWLSGMESLLQHYIQLDRTAQAVVVARITAQAFPWQPAPNVAAGKLLLKLERHRRAIRYFERGLEAGDQDPATLLLLAQTHLRLGETAKARVVVERLREVDPQHPAIVNLEPVLATQAREELATPRSEDPTSNSNKGEVQ